MSSAHRWLSYRERQIEYHKLARMVARAFHSVPELIVIDGLLHLQEKLDVESGVHKVTEKDLVKLLHLPEKRILEIVTQLRLAGFIHMSQCAPDQAAIKAAEDEAAAKAPLVFNYRRKSPIISAPRSKAPNFKIYVDYDSFTKMLKWRRFCVFEALNKKVDKSDVLYACPTPQCPQYMKPYSIIDLLTMGSGSKERFACESCEAVDPKTQKLIPTPLIVINEPNKNDDSQEKLKSLFNQQMQPISAQLRIVEALLEEEMANPDELPDEATRLAKFTELEQAHQKQIVVEVSDNKSKPSTGQAATGSKSGGATTSGGSRVLHVPTVAANAAKGMVAALPWEQQSVAGLENESKRAAESAAQESVAAAEEQERQFKENFDRELEILTARAQAEALNAVNEAEIDEQFMGEGDEMNESELGDLMVQVQGRDVPLSEITQTELALMTPDEMEMYESLTGEAF